VNTQRYAKRIGRLEEKMTVPEFEWGSTRIDRECLSERERMLFQKVQEITEQYGDDPRRIPDNVLVENSEIARKALEIMARRVFDLFKTIIDEVYLKEDNLNKWVFWCRFLAFWKTTMNIIEMRQREDAFYDQVQKKYGDDWPDDVGKPDYAGIGERDFDKALTALIQSSFKEEQPKDGTS